MEMASVTLKGALLRDPRFHPNLHECLVVSGVLMLEEKLVSIDTAMRMATPFNAHGDLRGIRPCFPVDLAGP
jgi:hypothetical protein